MSDLVRLLSLDGPVVGPGLVAVLVWLALSLNGVRSELKSVKCENKTAYDRVTEKLDGLAAAVAFLQGRQAERDQQVSASTLAGAVEQHLSVALKTKGGI